VLVPDVKEQVGASVAELGAALLAVGFAALPAMLLTGRVVDRVGPRVMPVALVLFGVAALLPGLAGSVPALALALVLVGATSGALDVVINVAASGLEASGGPRVMQLAHAAFSAGFLVAAVSVGLARAAGAEPLAVLAGTAVLLFVTALMNGGHPGAAPGPRAHRRLRFSRRLLLLGVLCGVAFVVESGIEYWSALFLETELDASPAVGGLGPGVFAAAMVAGRSLGHWLEAVVGDRLLLVGGAVTAAGGLALAAVAPAVPVALLGFGLGGVGNLAGGAHALRGSGAGCPRRRAGERGGNRDDRVLPRVPDRRSTHGVVSGAFDLRAGTAMLAAVALLLAAATASFARDALPLRRLQHPSRG
jgi:MFS family permease